MRRGLILAASIVVALAGAALADAPKRSPKPPPSPFSGPLVLVTKVPSVPVFYESSLRPQPRPSTLSTSSGQTARAVVALNAGFRPPERPRRLARKARRAEARVTPAAARRPASTAPANRDQGQAMICGDPAIQGGNLARMVGSRPGCGVASPVRVYSVSGVALSRPSVMNCPTALALRDWVDDSVKPTIGRLGGGVSELHVAAHYACRTRNNRPGAKISEHGKGNAIDISGLTLANGQSLTVSGDWRDPVKGKLMRAMHRGACGPFDTVLGPDADRYHQDHFHFDKRGGRAYCR